MERSCSRVLKLCNGVPSSAVLLASLALAWSDRNALATGEDLAAPHVFEIADRIHIARLGKRACIVHPKKISMSDTVAVMTGAMRPDQLPAEALA